MKTRIGLLIILLLTLSSTRLKAQTPAPPTGEPFTITGSYAASLGNSIQNGMQSTFEYNVVGRWSIRIDEIGITNPSGTLVNLAEGQWKIPADRVFGKSSPASFSKILIGLHGGLGAVKNSSGGVSFAASFGGSVDYQLSSFFFVRVADITDVYSRGLVPNNQQFGNYNNVNIGAGIGFNF